MNKIMVWGVIVFLTTDSFALETNSKYLKKTDECSKTEKAREVIVLKQWDLSAGVNTHTPSTRQRIPQTDSHLEIYRQLEEWIKGKKVDTVVVDGCEGEIDESFKPAFYGWTMKKLKERAKQAHFNTVLAHPGMKLKIQFKNRVKVICGDSVEDLKQGDLALSDARGDVGYISRLTQFKGEPARAKVYLEGVIESFRLSPKTSINRAIQVLTDDIRKSLATAQDSIQKRNAHFVEIISKLSTHKPVPVIVGGLQIEHLKSSLEKAKLNCEINEPVSYQAQEEKLKEDLEQWLKKK